MVIILTFVDLQLDAQNSYLFTYMGTYNEFREKNQIQGGSNMTGTDLCVNKPPTTSLFFFFFYQDASRTLEKMC
jgi:hypothetical protein